MGLRFRKSFRIGNCFRINISKSGIGYSFGTKGARITKKAGGGIRNTLSVPGTGISYTSDSKKRRSAKKVEQKPVEQPVIVLPEREQDDLPQNSTSCDVKDVVKKIKRTYFLPKLFKVLSIILGVIWFLVGVYTNEWLSFVVLLLLSLTAASTVTHFVLRYTLTVNLEYDIEADCIDEATRNVNKVIDFCKSADVWEANCYTVNMQGVKGKKGTLKRMRAIVSDKPCFPIKTNAPCVLISAKKNSYLFLPNMLLIFKGKNFAAIAYDDLRIERQNITIPEFSPQSKKVTVVRWAWQHETKSGEKDMRYTDNRRVAICKYGLLSFCAGKGFELNFISTNVYISSAQKQSS